MAPSKAGDLRDRGFTLIELLVVCGILAATAYLAWGSFKGVQESAEDDIAHAEMQRVADALKRFKADTGYYPGQGPFVLASADCTSPSGIQRAWATSKTDADPDAWLDSPANLILLFEAPALCANHPLAHIAAWNPDTRRGWRGPYLDLGARKWVDHGLSFNADSAGNTGTSADAPYGNGSPLAGAKILDIPAFGNGHRFRAVDAGWSVCAGQELTSGACMLGWRTLPRKATGYDPATHELVGHARPFVVFGLADGDSPRVIYFGRDGKYGGRNAADPCLPNASQPEGEDDAVLCLGNR